MDRQMLPDRVIRFNAEGVDGLGDRPKGGRLTWLDDGQLAALKALVLWAATAAALPGQLSKASRLRTELYNPSPAYSA